MARITRYIGGGARSIAITVPAFVSPGGWFLPARVWQIIGGKRWSLAIVTFDKRRQAVDMSTEAFLDPESSNPMEDSRG